jgi:arginine deiminase
MSHGVHSEAGRLRKVLVCRPGLAQQRLTPRNCAELLFDDVMWVAQAKTDHCAFTSLMQERDVEVLELHDLLADVVAVPQGRAWLLARKITASRVGLGLTDDLHVYGGVTLNPMHWPARRAETLLMKAIYQFHPMFAGDAQVWWGDPELDHGAATLEGGDVMPIGNGVVLVGMGERTTPQAWRCSRKRCSAGASPTGSSPPSCRARAARCTWTR